MFRLQTDRQPAVTHGNVPGAPRLRLDRDFASPACARRHLTYGGRLGSTGYTLKSSLSRSRISDTAAAAIRTNHQLCGRQLPLTVEQRSRYRWHATFERTPMPENIADLEPASFVPEPRFKADLPALRGPGDDTHAQATNCRHACPHRARRQNQARANCRTRSILRELFGGEIRSGSRARYRADSSLEP
jgi:hypothetical protein